MNNKEDNAYISMKHTQLDSDSNIINPSIGIVILLLCKILSRISV